MDKIITEETGGTGFYNEEEEESNDRKREEKMMDESTCDDVMLCSAFFYPPLFFFFVSTGAGVYCTVHLQYLPTYKATTAQHNTTQRIIITFLSFAYFILFLGCIYAIHPSTLQQQQQRQATSGGP